MKRVYLLILLFTLTIASCTSEEEKAANTMLDQAQLYYEQESFEESLRLLDSLQVTYPQQIEVRQKALELSRVVRLEQSRLDSIKIIPQMEQATLLADSLYQFFTLIEAPGMPDENVIRYKGYDPSSNPSSPFLDCYIMGDGELVMVAGVSGSRQIGTTYIQVHENISDTYIYSDTIPYDGGLNYRYETLGRHYERLTYRGEKGVPIASFIAQAPEDATIKVRFGSDNGRLGTWFALDRKAKEAIRESFYYYSTIEEIRSMHETLERHQRRLELQMERDKQKVISLH